MFVFVLQYFDFTNFSFHAHANLGANCATEEKEDLLFKALNSTGLPSNQPIRRPQTKRELQGNNLISRFFFYNILISRKKILCFQDEFVSRIMLTIRNILSDFQGL